MRRIAFCLVLLLGLVTVLPPPAAAEKAPLAPYLEPFEPLIGKTWRGELHVPGSKKTSYDVSRWERALNGTAIRILHSVDDGAYGGETLIFWDPDAEQLVFFYLTTAGFYTRGRFEEVDRGRFRSREKVSGEIDGITEVEANAELLEDGRLRLRTRMLKNGEWVDGHEVHFVEAPDAEVVFR